MTPTAFLCFAARLVGGGHLTDIEVVDLGRSHVLDPSVRASVEVKAHQSANQHNPYHLTSSFAPTHPCSRTLLHFLPSTNVLSPVFQFL